MIKAISVSKTGEREDASTAPTDSVVPGGDTTAPATPTGFTATAVQAGIDLKWTNPTDKDFMAVQIFRDTVNTFPGGSPLITISGERGKKMAFRDRSVAYGTTYYYWLRAVDASGNASSETSSVNASPSRTATDDISDNAVTVPIAANTSNWIYMVYNTWTEIQTIASITTHGGKVLLNFSFDVVDSDSIDHKYKCRVQRDSTDVYVGNLIDIAASKNGSFAASIMDEPSAGTYHYDLDIWMNEAWSVYQPLAYNRSLLAVELQK